MKRTLYTIFWEPLARLIFPKCKTVTKVDLDDNESAIFLCNHSGAIGPATMTLYFKKPHKTWIISYVMDKEVGANFFFHDALFGRSKKYKGFYRFISKITVRLLRPLLQIGNPIPVYHDKRIMQTFRESLEALEAGQNLVIFPECPTKYSEFVHSLYDGFADIGRMYYVKTGKCIKFYPTYIEKKNRVISIGEPIAYNPDLSPREQRKLIADYVLKGMDALARELPPFKPVPFLPQTWYDYYGEYENNIADYWALCNQKHSE